MIEVLATTTSPINSFKYLSCWQKLIGFLIKCKAIRVVSSFIRSKLTALTPIYTITNSIYFCINFFAINAVLLYFFLSIIISFHRKSV